MIYLLLRQPDVQQKNRMQAVRFCNASVPISRLILFIIVHLLHQHVSTPVHLSNHIVDSRLGDTMPIHKQILMRLRVMTCKAEKAAKIYPSRRRPERF
jgi:hypothetical protein